MVFANCHASFLHTAKQAAVTHLQKLLATLEEVGCLEDVFRILNIMYLCVRKLLEGLCSLWNKPLVAQLRAVAMHGACAVLSRAYILCAIVTNA